MYIDIYTLNLMYKFSMGFNMLYIRRIIIAPPVCIALAAPIKSKYHNCSVTIREERSHETIQFEMAHLKLSSGISGFTILFITLLIGYAIGEYEHLFNNGNGLCVGTNCPDRSGNGVSGAMWFGPRLGRRRRSGGMSTENENEINDIIKAIIGGTWSFIPHYGEKRHLTQFIPRLGREVDELLQRAIAINNNDHQAQSLDTKISDIDLHRQLMQPISIPLFQPRLGRQQIYIPPIRLDH